MCFVYILYLVCVNTVNRMNSAVVVTLRVGKETLINLQFLAIFLNGFHSIPEGN
jgi:hypothetical protein